MKRNKWMILAIVFLAIACKKGEEDVTAPIIKINSPTNGSVWSENDSIYLDIYIEDEDLHEYQISILKENQGEYDFKTHTHDQVISYKKSWYPTEDGDLQLVVKASDHNGNADQKAVSFKVK